jgi:hypothetical protein
MPQRLWFKTGNPSADASLRRINALADPHAHPVPNGLALEDWIEQVLGEIRSLPADLIRSLKPEALYCWDAPRRWDRLRVEEWYSRAQTGLLERLTLVSQHDVEDKAPITLSSAMGVTHDYRHALQEGLRALYPDQAAVPPRMLEQIARIATPNLADGLAVPRAAVGECLELSIVTTAGSTIPEAIPNHH